MANRIVGNTYIIDTASGNTALPWPSKAKIMAINLFSTDTSGRVEFTASDTTDVVIKIAHTGDHFVDNDGVTSIYLGGVTFDEMKVPVLTAGTAWVYFG